MHFKVLTPHNKIKVAVGLSGGVDSSVAAALLKNQGYDLIGVTMEIFDDPGRLNEIGRHGCYGPGETEDVEAAAQLCKKLDIPYYTLDLKEAYRKYVIGYFKHEYLLGRTPNPCVICNQIIKFGFLLEKAMEKGLDFQFFATGHYAKLEKTDGKVLLKKAEDRSKDQSYFLYRLTGNQLSRALFPLGDYTKAQVRKMARSMEFETADRAESQDFIAGNDYAVLFREEETEDGDVVDEDGNLLGRHRGIIHYTIGQRRGLGIASDRPLYVTKIDAENNRIVVGNRESLSCKGLIANDLNLVAIDRLDRQHRIEAKIRLNQKEIPATLFPHGKDRAKILFDTPQMSVAPGQSAVFYRGDTVLGGGYIERAIRSERFILVARMCEKCDPTQEI